MRLRISPWLWFRKIQSGCNGIVHFRVKYRRQPAEDLLPLPFDEFLHRSPETLCCRKTIPYGAPLRGLGSSARPRALAPTVHDIPPKIAHQASDRGCIFSPPNVSLLASKELMPSSRMRRTCNTRPKAGSNSSSRKIPLAVPSKSSRLGNKQRATITRVPWRNWCV